MKKVYVVMVWGLVDNFEDIQGVYSSIEKAEKEYNEIMAHTEDTITCEIIEKTLDNEF